MDNDFKPAEGVTLDNCLRYIEAIEQAAARDISRIGKGERSMILGVVSAALSNAANKIDKVRNEMEEKGQALPVTPEQKIMARMLFRLALGGEEKTN